MKHILPSCFYHFIYQKLKFLPRLGFSVLLLLLCSFAKDENNFLQSIKDILVSINAKGITVEQALDDLTRSTGLNFVYQNNVFDEKKIVNYEAQNTSLETVLKNLLTDPFKKNNIHILRHGNTIVLKAVKSVVNSDSTSAKPVSSQLPSVDKLTSNPPPQQAEESIRGTALDVNTKETLVGATVQLDGTSYGTSVDENGKFALVNIPPGSYTLRISLIGYSDYTQLVKVVKGSVLTIQARLKNSDVTLSEVVVEANRIANTEINVLSDRKNSSLIQDGVSSQTIERTAAITTVQALQKVTGVSIRDGKYISVRGLTDRNIVVQLNGARLSSSNPTRSSVPLDLIPAQLLDNINVEKTVLPNRPGDAAGAVVELKTKSIPDSFNVSLIAQTGYNDAIGFNGTYTSFQGGRLGFWGQGTDQLQLKPEFLNLRNIPATSRLINKEAVGLDYLITDRSSITSQTYALQLDKIEQTITPILNTKNYTAPLNQLYTITVGDRFKLGKVQRLGVLFGVNYYQRYEQIVNGVNNRYYMNENNDVVTYGVSQSNIATPNRLRLFKQYAYNEQRGTQITSYGSLAALTYRITPGNEVSVHYIGNYGFETQATQLNGSPNLRVLPAVVPSGLALAPPPYPTFSLHTNYLQYFLFTTKRTFNTLQFRGEHKLAKINGNYLQFSWNASGSQSLEENPDFRITNLAIDSAGYVGPIQSSKGLINVSYKPFFVQDSTQRYWRRLYENNRNIVGGFTLPILIRGILVTAKTGVYWLQRKRDYTQVQVQSPNPNNFYDQGRSLSQLNGDINAFISTPNIGILKGADVLAGQPYVAGHLYYPTRSGVDYNLNQYITAFYGMVDADLSKKFRIAGGIRIEQTDVKGLRDTTFVGIPPSISTYEQYRINYVVRQEEYQWLPSGTLIYHPNEATNVRLSASRTLARPELGELMPVKIVDPIQQAFLVGNPDLKNAVYDATDVRWEWFPKLGEVFAASVFYKHVANNLERVFTRATGFNRFGPGYNTISYRNNPNTGFVAGIELEARKSFDFISPRLRHFFAGANVFLAMSQTKISPKEQYVLTQYDRSFPDKRPLYEQPNYIINANAGYENPEIGLNTNLYFNWTGERLVEINTDGTPNIYERPSPDLDYTFSFKIWRGLIIKGFAKNLINASTDWIYKNPGTTKPFGDYGETYYRQRYRRGREYSLGISFQF